MTGDGALEVWAGLGWGVKVELFLGHDQSRDPPIAFETNSEMRLQYERFNIETELASGERYGPKSIF